MYEKLISSSSKIENILSAGVLFVIFLLCGFLPLGWYAYLRLDILYSSYFSKTSYTNYVNVLTIAVFLAMISIVVVLIWFANKANAENKAPERWGIYSNMFGGVAILSLGLFSFYESQLQMSLAQDYLITLVALPTIYAFPLIGFILGIVGIKTLWGKVGILLSGGQLINLLIPLILIFFTHT